MSGLSVPDLEATLNQALIAGDIDLVIEALRKLKEQNVEVTFKRKEVAPQFYSLQQPSTQPFAGAAQQGYYGGAAPPNSQTMQPSTQPSAGAAQQGYFGGTVPPNSQGMQPNTQPFAAFPQQGQYGGAAPANSQGMQPNYPGYPAQPRYK